MHNRTDANGAMWDDGDSHGRVACGIKTMVFTIAVLVAAGCVLVLYFARAAGRVNPANLGWMSAQWLAEHRASQLS